MCLSLRLLPLLLLYKDVRLLMDVVSGGPKIMIHMQIGRGGSDLFQVVCTTCVQVAVEPLGSVQSVGWFSGYR